MTIEARFDDDKTVVLVGHMRISVKHDGNYARLSTDGMYDRIDDAIAVLAEVHARYESETE